MKLKAIRSSVIRSSLSKVLQFKNIDDLMNILKKQKKKIFN